VEDERSMYVPRGGGCCIENESEADWRMEVLNEGKGGSEILLNEGK